MNHQALRELRTKAGMSQEELAFKAGISVSMVTKLECGRTDASTKTVKALAAALALRLPDTDNILLTLIGGPAAQGAPQEVPNA